VRAIKALANLRGINEDENIGIDIIRKSLETPLRLIAENAGVESSVVLQRVLNGKDAYGYNARTDKFEDLKAAGVIDPAKVTRIALENAASVAGMVLMMEVSISNRPEKKAAGGGHDHHHDYGDMM
jgi:chaperonin GroEL